MLWAAQISLLMADTLLKRCGGAAGDRSARVTPLSADFNVLESEPETRCRPTTTVCHAPEMCACTWPSWTRQPVAAEAGTDTTPGASTSMLVVFPLSCKSLILFGVIRPELAWL